MEDRRPVLVVVAGANGSGKTTLTTQLLSDQWLQGVAYLNPDQIAQDRFGGWNDRDAVLKAAQFVQQQREAALGSKESLAFETVFSAPDKLAYVQRAKQAGYFVRLFYVMTAGPTDTGRRCRIGKRAAESIDDLGDRNVDRFYALDNSIDDQPVRRIFRCVEGVIAKEYEPPPHDAAKMLRDGVMA